MRRVCAGAPVHHTGMEEVAWPGKRMRRVCTCIPVHYERTDRDADATIAHGYTGTP
jgi:hypothetical protein